MNQKQKVQKVCGGGGAMWSSRELEWQEPASVRRELKQPAF